MNHPDPFPSPVSVPFADSRDGERLLALLAGSLGFTWVADFLFWNSHLGLSVGLFSLLLAGAVLVLRKPKGEALPWTTLTLLSLAAVQSAIEVSLSNILVLTALLLYVGGRSSFPQLSSVWSQVSEAAFAVLRAPARWPWLCGALAKSELVHVGLDTVTADRASRSVQILAPAIGLGVVFTLLFARGNAIFADLLQRGSHLVLAWLLDFDFSIARLLLWCLVSSVVLALLQPPESPGKRWWRRELGLFPRTDVRTAVWQSAAVLLTLNALFFLVNTIDAVFLWMHAARPADVSFSAYVHQGVYSLILAALLSGAVLIVIFQQIRSVAGSRTLKILALVWIAQNLLLLAAVAWRLKLYVDAYDLSELRVYVGCFLLLVTAGFVLLIRHILQLGELHRLIWRNAVCAFAMFFLIQFCDVANWVARANFHRWQSNPERPLDLKYLSSLGAGAWPTLVNLAGHSRSPAMAAEARSHLQKIADAEQQRIGRADWRAWQARRDLRSRWLISEANRWR